MPRKLPWVQKENATAGLRPNRQSSATRPSKKRVKISEPESKVDEEATISESTKSKQPRGRACSPSTSPPPKAPIERFMNGGIDQDDKYRMVEDEFLSIAQQFTVHLHAAEYKRQQNIVKVRNAEAINFISRPVTGKMPVHTKRRVEGVAKAQAQRTILQTLLGKREGEVESSDDSDGDGLPYVGTTLHGLMDSPRGKSASLSKVRGLNVATRAAAGFQKPTGKSSQISPSVSPISKAASRFQPSKPDFDGSTESSDGDDDLDAPIAPPKLASFQRKPNTLPNRMEVLHPALSATKITQSLASSHFSKKPSPDERTTTTFEPTKPEPSSMETARIQSDSRARIARRLEQTRSKRAKQNQEEQKIPKAVIPTFF